MEVSIMLRKQMCSGCAHAPVYDNQGNKVAEKTCHFCRTPDATTVEEQTKRDKKSIEASDRIQIYNHGYYYHHGNGKNGFPQNHTKALELYHKAGELGHAMAYSNIGFCYVNGHGVKVDKEKATHYYELAAMQGNEVARHNLGYY